MSDRRVVIIGFAVGVAMLASRATWRAGARYSQADSVETRLQAAEIALLVFRATLEGADSPHAYFVLPSRVPLSAVQASQALAAIEKPVRCAASMDQVILAVECQTLQDVESLAQHDRGSAGHVSFLEEGVRERCSVPVSDTKLLLRRRGTTMMVRFDALATWLREYDMNFSLGVTESVKAPPGVCMVLEVGPRAAIKVERGQTGTVRS